MIGFDSLKLLRWLCAQDPVAFLLRPAEPQTRCVLFFSGASPPDLCGVARSRDHLAVPFGAGAGFSWTAFPRAPIPQRPHTMRLLS